MTVNWKNKNTYSLGAALFHSVIAIKGLYSEKKELRTGLFLHNIFLYNMCTNLCLAGDRYIICGADSALYRGNVTGNLFTI